MRKEERGGRDGETKKLQNRMKPVLSKGNKNELLWSQIEKDGFRLKTVSRTGAKPP